MKKHFFDLQLFADAAASASGDTGAASGAVTDQGNTDGEKKPATTDKPEAVKKYTDEDVNAIIDKKFAEWQKKQDKAVDEVKKLSEMNATQKAEYQRDQLQKELDELKKANSLSEMSKTARKMLAENDINIPDELLSFMVSTDAEETKTAVDSFSKLYKDAVEAAVKERLRGETPKKGTGGAAPMTKEQIMAIRDTELRQKKMLEHRELFNI